MLPSLLIAGLALAAGALASAADKEVVPMNLHEFDLKDVRLLDGPCKSAVETNRKYILSLNPDSLLFNFRTTAGLPAPGRPYAGWEAPEIEVRGHFVGHYLSACAMLYAALGDEQCKQRGDFMVTEMAKCQAAHGNGYLSAFPESFWDRLEGLERPPWAPFYVIHKIMAGMYDMYRLCGNTQALEVLKGMAGYFERRSDRISDAHWDRILNVEYGGMSEVLHDLYSVTKDPKHLKLAHRFDKAAFLGPLALEHDNLSGLHGNTHIPIVIGAARHYELTGDERYRTAATYFWKQVAEARSYATGGSTEGEAWPEPYKLAGTFAHHNHETCKTYNMLRLTRYLYRWTAEPKYAEFYERAFFNGILGTQQPGTGQLMYYVPMATGYRRLFGTADSAFWCCYGTGVENWAKTAEGIYYYDNDGITVSLFIPSVVEWRQKGVRLEQHTVFPDEPSTKLTIHCERPTEFTVRIRVPFWCTHGYVVKVNGDSVGADAISEGYAHLRRVWSDGDTIEAVMPMTLRTMPLPDDANMVAVLYGPIVLAGVLKETLPEKPSQNSGNMHGFAPPVSFDGYFLADPTKPSEWLRPAQGAPLEYETVGQEHSIRFRPFYKVVEEPYGIYWRVVQKGSPQYQEILDREAESKALDARVVDEVLIGNDESERAHGLQGERTASGTYHGKVWRHTDSWFSYSLQTKGRTDLVLLCTYWGGEGGNRRFDILVEDKVIASPSLGRQAPGKFYDVEYPIPPELLQGRDKVTIKFQAKPDNTAGGIFRCALLRPKD